jgi:hypothetical protein
LNDPLNKLMFGKIQNMRLEVRISLDNKKFIKWVNLIFLLNQGQDQTPLREGGTWLCLNTVQSKIGVLLNLPSRLLEEKKSNAQSRGFMVSNYVNNPEINLDSYMEELQKTKTNYTGFNFLGLERQSGSKWVEIDFFSNKYLTSWIENGELNT